MRSLAIGLISFACIVASLLIGMFLQRLMPEHHLSKDSKDAIKVGSGLIATLAALVLGLLVSSAKGTFDAANAGITQGAAKLIALDGALARYGDGAKPIREQLRGNISVMVDTIWPEEKIGVKSSTSLERARGAENVQEMIQALEPATDLQRSLKARALDLNNDVVQLRWLLVEQQQVGLPVPLVVVLVFWLSILYASFGLAVPRNGTVICVLLVCALSASAAIFLISEMSNPLDGSIKVSSAPMLKALEHLGR